MIAAYASKLSNAPLKFHHEAYKLVHQQMKKVLIAMTDLQLYIINKPTLYRLFLSGLPGSG